MKTLEQLKQAVDYQQTDAHFLSFLALLEERGVIAIAAGDVDADAGIVSDDFFRRLAAVYGVELDGAMRPVRRAWEG